MPAEGAAARGDWPGHRVGAVPAAGPVRYGRAWLRPGCWTCRGGGPGAAAGLVRGSGRSWPRQGHHKAARAGAESGRRTGCLTF